MYEDHRFLTAFILLTVMIAFDAIMLSILMGRPIINLPLF